jgi:hypothetical protein
MRHAAIVTTRPHGWELEATDLPSFVNRSPLTPASQLVAATEKAAEAEGGAA